MKPVMLITLATVVACQSAGPTEAATPTSQPATRAAAPKKPSTQLAKPPAEGLAVATFAGGCFWCMEPPFDKVEGVKSTTSGYAGGKEKGPSYKDVAYGRTGHTESVQVVYDPKVVTYAKLLEVFWRNIDPTDAGGQFVDRGSQYRPMIFTHSAEQKAAAEASKKALMDSKRFKKPIAVKIETAGDFWVAEDYHQDFYKKSASHYKRYRNGSGRDTFIAQYWTAKKK